MRLTRQEPIIPHNLFKNFCRVLERGDLDLDTKLGRYRTLIKSCPQANQYVLLYILDLLALFKHHQAKNKMTAQNLAIVFQPSILNIQNLTSKSEHTLAVSVIEFLINYQDSFVLGLTPPPPSDKRPEELTTPSATHDLEDYMIIPSDSDEEVGEYHVHIGGGAHLARSGTNLNAQSSALFARRERKKRMEQQRYMSEHSKPPTLGSSDGDHASRQSPRLLRSFSQRRRANSHTDGKVDEVPMPSFKDQERNVSKLNVTQPSHKSRDMNQGQLQQQHLERPSLSQRSISAHNVSHRESLRPTVTDDQVSRINDDKRAQPSYTPTISAARLPSPKSEERPPLSPSIALFPPNELNPMSYLQTTSIRHAHPYVASARSLAEAPSQIPTNLGSFVYSDGTAQTQPLVRSVSADAAPPTQPAPIPFLGQSRARDMISLNGSDAIPVPHTSPQPPPTILPTSTTSAISDSTLQHAKVVLTISAQPESH